MGPPLVLGTPAIDDARHVDKTCAVSGTLIVLNGASSSGKTSIAHELQRRWPRPLLVTGLDAAITEWPTHLIMDFSERRGDLMPNPGIRIVPGQGPAPSWITEFSDDFLNMLRLRHASWAALHEDGFDLVVDHVIVDSTIRSMARDSLVGATWVRVDCDVDEAVRREAARPDRHAGFASGTAAIVHDEMTYDFCVDTTARTPGENARLIIDYLARATDASKGRE